MIDCPFRCFLAAGFYYLKSIASSAGRFAGRQSSRHMKRELIESPWWMRLTASPRSFATERIVTLGQFVTTARGRSEERRVGRGGRWWGGRARCRKRVCRGGGGCACG